MNPLNRLKSLLPGDATLVGQVTGVNSDGTVDVLLVGGGSVVATGTGYVAGDAVFVKGSLVTGAAPSLSKVTIEV